MINIATSTASSKPSIGAINTCDKVAPTVPLPFTISSPTNLAAGSTCDSIASKTIKIIIIE